MAVMGNAPHETMELLKTCGESVHERMVEFPLWEEYAESIKSEIADLKNVGGSLAGMTTAGKFLEHFTAYPFIHIDIGGFAFVQKSGSYRGKGGTGAGVRLLVEFLKKF
jgi:leucyl aminopeptidase